MFRNFLFLFAAIISFGVINAQEPYEFTEVINLETSPVLSQGNTSTCWSFGSTSFLESEIIRTTGKFIDLSEMYTVRNTYPAKAENFVMRSGKAQFSQGGLAHDVFNTIAEYGIVPNSLFTGLSNNETYHNHSEMGAVLRSMVEAYAKNPSGKLSKKWKEAIDAVLSTYLGSKISSFNYEGKVYTPQSFLEMTKINPSDYISLTSFTHSKFYEQFILNIPDNWSNGSFYNLPIDELIKTIDAALKNGFTVAFNSDISEPTFSSKHGVAVIPESAENNSKALEGIYPEKTISQDYRQDEFENFTTTDDHLMHITGMLKDQNGNKYYMVKNSWGSNSPGVTFGGYVYFSESYIRLKAISILVHKDAVPKTIATKLSL